MFFFLVVLSRIRNYKEEIFSYLKMLLINKKYLKEIKRTNRFHKLPLIIHIKNIKKIGEIPND